MGVVIRASRLSEGTEAQHFDPRGECHAPFWLDCWRRFLTAAVLLSAVAMMVKDLDAPIHGSFYFRQAHLAANIERFTGNGRRSCPRRTTSTCPMRSSISLCPSSW